MILSLTRKLELRRDQLNIDLKSTQDPKLIGYITGRIDELNAILPMVFDYQKSIIEFDEFEKERA